MSEPTPPPSPMAPISPTAPQERKLFVLLACAGVGSRALRAGAPERPKQYQMLCGQPLVLHSLAVFESLAPWPVALAVAVAPQDELIDGLLGGRAVQVLRSGGASRADTVRQALQDWQRLPGGPGANDWVLVHDAARCLLEPAQVRRLVERCAGDAVGGLLALPLPDTLKCEHSGPLVGRVAQTLDRAGKWLAQTPQMFRAGALVHALQQAQLQGLPITDEASAMEAQGHCPVLVAGSAQNFKITYPEDFSLAQAVLEARQSPRQDPQTTATAIAAKGLPMKPSASSNLPFRLGQGWDTHALVEGRPLVLGGVAIDWPKGLLGHSDADVLLHAITDAVLGAAALGDIGRHFPDTDERFKGADSMRLLVEAAARVRAQGWRVGNIDATIVAQAPKLAPHLPAMCAGIAAALGLELGQVNVKAKTAEKMGPVGEGKAMEAQAVALLLPA